MDLQAETEQVAHFTADGKAAFMADDRTQYAVMMAYARIGEITKNIPDNLLATQPDIPWREIKGFRDVLIHRYFDVQLPIIWDAVEQLPALQAAVQALLDSLPDDEGEDDA